LNPPSAAPPTPARQSDGAGFSDHGQRPLWIDVGP